MRPEQLNISEYILEAQFEAEAIRLLSTQRSNLLPIEISIINDAPYSFLTKLFKDRYIVLKEDEEGLTNFIEEVGQKSMVNSYFRSQSLQELTEV